MTDSRIDNLLERAGQNWGVQSWSYDSTSKYNTKINTLGSMTTIRAIRSETAKERIRRDVRGQDRTIDAQILVSVDAVDVTDIEDTTKEPPVFTSPSGIKYDAIAVGREAEDILGMRRIFLVQRRGVGT